MLLFQIMPPSSSLTVSKSLFLISVSPLLPYKQDQEYYISRFHIYALICEMCPFLTSLCIIGSRFIHLIRTDSNAFLFMDEQYSIVYMYHSFFIHSSVDGHLGCFQVFAIVNRAAMNIGVHVSFSTIISLVYMPSSGIVGSQDSFISRFLRTVHSGYVIYIHTNSARGFPFSTASPAFIVCSSIDDVHPDRCPSLTCISLTASMENSAVATGLEKVSFHSNHKERQCQRMLKLPHNCTHLTYY